MLYLILNIVMGFYHAHIHVLKNWITFEWQLAIILFYKPEFQLFSIYQENWLYKYYTDVKEWLFTKKNTLIIQFSFKFQGT